jgi:hypothetical protein
MHFKCYEAHCTLHILGAKSLRLKTLFQLLEQIDTLFIVFIKFDFVVTICDHGSNDFKPLDVSKITISTTLR